MVRHAPWKHVDITRATEWLHEARRLLYEGPDSCVNDGPGPSGGEAQPQAHIANMLYFG